MVQLSEDDILTKEVLYLEGIHLFHYRTSSCSQKIRSFLNLKDVYWVSHHVDIQKNEHITRHFLGINPRGVVPVLVDDGTVHIESNDILLHLEKKFPNPPLIPDDQVQEVSELLALEGSLHMDLRTVTFRFIFDPDKPPKSDEDLEQMTRLGSGTINGQPDGAIGKEVAFWQRYAQERIGDEQLKASVDRFHDAFQVISARLADSTFILGDRLTLVDIAWFIYAQRLFFAGYPLARLHPNLERWRNDMLDIPEIAREVELPDALAEMIEARSRKLSAEGRSLANICFPN